MCIFDLFPMGENWLFDVWQLANASIITESMIAKRLWNKLPW